MTDNLKLVESENYIVYEKDVSYIQKRGIGVNWKEGLMKGVYRPELENAHGTYYRGPPGCVVQFMEEKSIGPFDGGVWVPKDRINVSPRIYYYFGFNTAAAQKSGGPVVVAIMSGFKGRIAFMLPTDKKTFLNDVVVSNIPFK